MKYLSRQGVGVACVLFGGCYPSAETTCTSAANKMKACGREWVTQQRCMDSLSKAEADKGAEAKKARKMVVAASKSERCEVAAMGMGMFLPQDIRPAPTSAPIVSVSPPAVEAQENFPPGTVGAQAVVQALMNPHGSTVQSLRPDAADCAAIFTDPSIATECAPYYADLFSKSAGSIAPKPGQTASRLFSATREDFVSGTGGSLNFPGGYKRLAGSLKPTMTWYAFKFVEPGKTVGMAFDGLVYVNGHWRMFPKPFRLLK